MTIEKDHNSSNLERVSPNFMVTYQKFYQPGEKIAAIDEMTGQDVILTLNSVGDLAYFSATDEVKHLKVISPLSRISLTEDASQDLQRRQNESQKTVIQQISGFNQALLELTEAFAPPVKVENVYKKSSWYVLPPRLAVLPPESLKVHYFSYSKNFPSHSLKSRAEYTVNHLARTYARMARKEQNSDKLVVGVTNIPHESQFKKWVEFYFRKNYFDSHLDANIRNDVWQLQFWMDQDYRD